MKKASRLRGKWKSYIKCLHKKKSVNLSKRFATLLKHFYKEKLKLSETKTNIENLK
jgi:hypothetical protein